jgi:hypothetical protein
MAMPVSPNIGIAANAIVMAKLPLRSFKNLEQTSLADWTYFTSASFRFPNLNLAAGTPDRRIVRIYTGMEFNKR